MTLPYFRYLSLNLIYIPAFCNPLCKFINLYLFSRQLLTDCGIGLTGPEAADAPVVNQHRVLLFCQLKAMLDIVENDLFRYRSYITISLL